MIKTIEHHIQNIASEQNSNVNSSEIFNHTVILLAEIRENIDYLILEQDDSLPSCLEKLQKLIGYIHINNTQKIQTIKEYNSLIEDIFESYDHIQIKKENLLIREQNSKTTTRIQTESISDFLDKGQNEKLKENLYNQIKENYDSLMIKEIINYNSSRQKQIDYKKQDVSSQNTSKQTNSLNKKLIYLWIIVSFVILAEVTFVCIFVYQNKEFLSDFPILNFFSDEPNTLELWKDE
jgi:dGTP triphosphohydrolase